MQASRLIAAFKATYPKALKADTRTKRFVATGAFEPEASSGSLAEYLMWLAHASADKPEGIEDARIDLTQIDPKINACVHQSSLRCAGLQIRYESMSHPRGGDRLIYPIHARAGGTALARARLVLRA